MPSTFGPTDGREEIKSKETLKLYEIDVLVNGAF